MPRYRITFAKTEAMRFTGHLDLHRAWERTFRRAVLPLAYSGGFSPHPRLTLAAALPLGCVSENDLLDAWLTEDLPVEVVVAGLRRAAPPGLDIATAARVDLREPSLPAQVAGAEYVIRLDDPPSQETLETRLASLLAADHLPRKRRGKDYDLRPLVESLELSGDGLGLSMRLAAREGATGRPEEVLAALGLDPAHAFIRRIALRLEREATGIEGQL